MNNIDVKIVVALIALFSAIIGAVITGFFNYFVNKKLESDKRIKEKQKEVYALYFERLQRIMNSDNPNSEFYPFQDSINQVCLYGDNKTSSYVKEYYETLVKSVNENNPLDKSTHTSYTTKIMNAMRKSLGLKSFNSFTLVKFTPNKLSK